MQVDKEDLNLVSDKKYSDFSEKVISVLNHKLSNHPIMQKYTTEITNIRSLKSNFSKITNPGNE